MEESSASSEEVAREQFSEAARVGLPAEGDDEGR
jgi:hypothetical protein